MQVSVFQFQTCADILLGPMTYRKTGGYWKIPTLSFILNNNNFNLKYEHVLDY
jgi:hypothetical protein